MTTFKGSLGYSSQTKRDKFISQYTDVQNDEMVKIFMGNKRGCLLQPLPCICLYICLCPIITGPPAFTTPAILRQRRYRTVWRGGVGERCRCVYKEPPSISISTSLPPSVAVARRAVITLVSALPGATPPPARGGGHP